MLLDVVVIQGGITMRKYVLDKKWTGGSERNFVMVEPTTKKEEEVMELVYGVDKPLKNHPELAKCLYGESLLDCPEREEVFFLMKFFSIGNREKGAIRAAGWLHRHAMEAGYDPATGRIHVWPKEK